MSEKWELKGIRPGAVFFLSVGLFLSVIIRQADALAFQEKTIQHDAAAVLKLIQVYVTDGDGKPVMDLEMENFALFDNGERKLVTDFERHILADLKGAASGTAPERSSAVARLNRKFFFFLDLSGLDEVGVIQSKNAALHFVDNRVQPGDEIGVFSFTPLRGLVLHVYLTAEMEKVKKALGDIKEIPIKQRIENDLSLAREIARAEAEMGQARGGGGGSGAPIGGTSMSEWMGSAMGLDEISLKQFGARGVGRLIAEMVELARGLEYIPGNKNFIFFSGVDNAALRPAFSYLGRMLAAANCSMFTIDAVGARDNLVGPVRDHENVMEELSIASGGKFFADVKNVESMTADIQRMTGNYYVLGYYVNEAWDGMYHRIDVGVSRPGCRVFAQGGFFNPRPFDQLSPFEKQLHLIDVALSDSPYHRAPVYLQTQAFVCPVEKRNDVILLSELPLDGMEPVRHEKAEIMTLIFDGEQKLVYSGQGEINLEKLPHNRMFYYSLSSLPAGEYVCRVVIRNPDTGESAVGRADVSIEEMDPSEPSFFPPMYLIPDKPAAYVREMQKGRKKGGPAGTLQSYYPLLGVKHSPFLGILERGVNSFYAVFRMDGQEEKSGIRFAVTITDEKGDRFAPGLKGLMQRRIDSSDVLLFQVSLPELTAGEYRMDWVVLDAKGRVLHRFSMNIVRE
ncbi:MAG: VWA domain-containing protein [Candidatus Aminicenantes bacterium]|nr:VWA domain-containing protein [Candidatus Aminicenantes bacterium]